MTCQTLNRFQSLMVELEHYYKKHFPRTICHDPMTSRTLNRLQRLMVGRVHNYKNTLVLYVMINATNDKSDNKYTAKANGWT